MVKPTLSVHVNATEYLSNKLAHELSRLIGREHFPFDPTYLRTKNLKVNVFFSLKVRNIIYDIRYRIILSTGQYVSTIILFL